jgi:hypothetical protein
MYFAHVAFLGHFRLVSVFRGPGAMGEVGGALMGVGERVWSWPSHRYGAPTVIFPVNQHFVEMGVLLDGGGVPCQVGVGRVA